MVTPDRPHDIRRCKADVCKAEIVFARTKVKGRPVPLDARPTKGYILQWVSDPQDPVRGGHWEAELVTVWVPHHFTCKDVERFRK